MKRIRTPAVILGLLYFIFFGCLVWSSPPLPTRLATHFDGNGQANGWMRSSAYLRSMVVFGLVFPLFVPAISYVSRFFPQCCNIPHRDYWFAPPRRGVVFDYLFRHSLWFACMALCFVMEIHFLTMNANSLGSAHLSTLRVLPLAGCFLVGTAIWLLSMFRHFNHVA